MIKMYTFGVKAERSVAPNPCHYYQKSKKRAGAKAAYVQNIIRNANDLSAAPRPLNSNFKECKISIPTQARLSAPCGLFGLISLVNDLLVYQHRSQAE